MCSLKKDFCDYVSSELFKIIPLDDFLDPLFVLLFAFSLCFNKVKILLKNPQSWLKRGKNKKNLIFLHGFSSKVYNEILNEINLIISNSYHYCFSYETFGCETEFQGRQYCVFCQITNCYELDKLEEIKFKPLQMINYAAELYKDLKIVHDFDPLIAELWCGEYESKWKNWYTGKTRGCYLSECDSF